MTEHFLKAANRKRKSVNFGSKGPITQCNFYCKSTLGKLKIDRYMFPSQFANILETGQTFITNLYF